MPVTKEQAVEAMEFHHGECTETRGPRGGVSVSIERWRRNGETKTWKTRPEAFRVPVKYGMRAYGSIDLYNAKDFHTADECPLEG